MNPIIGIALLVPAGVATLIFAGQYLRGHHAEWLRDLDRDWDAQTEYFREGLRARGLSASWEMTDAQLCEFVGASRARQFRESRPRP